MHTLSFALPQVHGHRGCRGLFPENTLPAFLHALALGVDALELDVVISADNQVVVAHEPWLSAQLGLSPTGQPITGSKREYNLYQMSYDLIRQCEVGLSPHPLFPTQQLVPTYRPLLREVLLATEAACQQLGRPPVRYSIEIKSTRATEELYHPSPTEFVRLVLGECPAAVLSRTTLLSFDFRILQEVRRWQPSLAVCLLTESSFDSTTVFHELGFVPEVFGPDYQLLNRQLAQDMQSRYPVLQIVCWTINEYAAMLEASKWGISGITTDYPDVAQAVLKKAV
ncbi:glycerophosphodiester phosphodiesterase [Hymenobacter sp. RP-2-7]|uniref:Glycerophosphodiester phosphodiesterase n=1 Tax=Hymenobacter polaris TaxID=2682546 RepID=A0A7Y0AGJ8_9BACT|nr:glycerophosphodiester phosphodiesterase family protein [Hymenobacter polaris]NML66894.1 glycerophosphodiester phosphodiesterase [Hymenobacter polaris]